MPGQTRVRGIKKSVSVKSVDTRPKWYFSSLQPVLLPKTILNIQQIKYLYEYIHQNGINGSIPIDGFMDARESIKMICGHINPSLKIAQSVINCIWLWTLIPSMINTSFHLDKSTNKKANREQLLGLKREDVDEIISKKRICHMKVTSAAGATIIECGITFHLCLFHFGYIKFDEYCFFFTTNIFIF